MILILVGLTLIMLLCQIEPISMWAEWNKQAIYAGEYWRIVTGNFTHANGYHLAMNVLGVWLMYAIFKPQYKIKEFCILIALLSISVGGLLLLTPMQIYVGFSGVLHGIFGFYAVKEALYHSHKPHKYRFNLSWLLVLGLVVKIAWEQLFGSPTNSAELIHMSVAINAHLFGAVTGLVLACYTLISTSQRSTTKK